MNDKSKELLQQAYRRAGELSKHPILSQYWNQLSLVVKGSVSRGNCDQYSDIDFVFFCDDNVRKAIINGYRAAQLSTREDGVFLPIGDWEGHYHFETFGMLNGYFQENNYPQVWEFQLAIPIHDPESRFKHTIAQQSEHFLAHPIEVIKRLYISLQLTLDWMRHPLKRGDAIATNLHCSKIVKELCQLSYILDGKSYPHDKWLSTFLSTTRLGKLLEKRIISYLSVIPVGGAIIPHLELNEYPCYQQAWEFINESVHFIREHYGDYPWMDEWYLYG
ncbi:nucleotidyltransferase domain-containing protein [Paenibacillus alvei]|uniref:nucleotidyltransferase domain-containing protein n=1 Tax=Paenibacillus alvei TaxID=44250 RepID=UPI0018CD59CD|nr:nucleotidyltransferase domain-containing protein [Paenibacillus alvei]MBG9737321.1 hypothetical protein [Paenibacillus alvei]MBG9746136.1 hypothetical protein [Paenibacillus alvei]MCY9579152.1 nucleotidyltransferase domain-containing protein [Paenibacillus alvei]MCY9583579.1 nucleotidyltransferase domain-containing protein [Paenibacillus alvei]